MIFMIMIFSSTKRSSPTSSRGSSAQTVQKNVCSRGQNRAIHEPTGSHFALTQPAFLETAALAPGHHQRPHDIVRDIKFERLPRQGSLQAHAAPELMRDRDFRQRVGWRRDVEGPTPGLLRWEAPPPRQPSNSSGTRLNAGSRFQRAHRSAPGPRGWAPSSPSRHSRRT